jgi:Spy/CpxP family protein refolding chaperone
MHARSKLAVSFLAGIHAVPSLLAQNFPPGPGPDQSAAGDGPPPRHRMRPGQQGRPDGGRRGEEDRGGGRFRGMRGHHGKRGGFALARLIDDPMAREKLGITTDQASKIHQLTSEFRKSAIRGRADLQVKQLELQDLLGADSPDRAAIDKKIDEMSAARLAQAKARVHYRLAMRDVLTPEQRQKLQQTRAESCHRGFEGGPPRGPRGRTPSPNP